MCGVHVCGSRKRRDLSHRLSCLAAKMKKMEMQLWLWDHLSPSSVHGWNKLLSLVSLHTHSALLRRRRWCWHQAKEQFIEIFPNGWSIVLLIEKNLWLWLWRGYSLAAGNQKFRLMNADSNPRSHVLFSGINILSIICIQYKLLWTVWQIFCLTKYVKNVWLIYPSGQWCFDSYAQNSLWIVSHFIYLAFVWTYIIIHNHT